MNRVLKKFLVCILIVVLSCNFVFCNFNCNVVYAADTIFSLGSVGNLVSGLVGLLTWPLTLPIAASLIGVLDIIGALAKVGGLSTSASITPFTVLFNEIPLVDINFFDFSSGDEIIKSFREAVAGWYYTMRLIAAMILLVILIYIGIRMALTSIASEKAMYKKMLVDWTTSIALLFLLHYIMLFIITCNNVLVDAMKHATSGSRIRYNAI